MKLLMFQAKRFWFRSFSKTLDFVEDQEVEQEVLDAAVIFIHAEAGDEAQGPSLLTKALKNIKWIANKRGLKNIVLHSFTHLAETTAPAEYAQGALETLAARLRDAGYSVAVTPFGYFCEWDLSVYGESLAKVYKAL
ncbi:MAG: hypothetical protein H5T65_04620 [Chloroflexi bacterium]|nr:hypothetical protein [Chloroflexota bacterium]